MSASPAQAILTSYRNATASTGARIYAASRVARLAVKYDATVDAQTNHRNAAQALCDRLGWVSPRIGGELPSGDFAWVMDEIFEQQAAAA